MKFESFVAPGGYNGELLLVVLEEITLMKLGMTVQ